jgi:hypothetical protein
MRSFLPAVITVASDTSVSVTLSLWPVMVMPAAGDRDMLVFMAFSSFRQTSVSGTAPGRRRT